MRPTLQIAIATAVLLSCATSAQAAPTQLARELAPTRVAAWEGTVVWSRLDARSGRYALVKSVDGGAAEPVGVRSRTRPFDVDLGTNSLGSTYAVYTRDGDVYMTHVASGRERRLTGLTSKPYAERDPTIHRGDVAFVRRVRGRDQLREGRTSRRSRGTHLLVARSTIVMAELSPKHVAYVDTRPGPISDNGSKRVHIRNRRTGRDHIVYTATSGGANYADVTRPSYVSSPAGFMWVRTNAGSGRGNRVVLYILRGSKLVYAQGTAREISSAWAGRALGLATSSALEGGRERALEEGPLICRGSLAAPSSCTVELIGRPSFTRGP